MNFTDLAALASRLEMLGALLGVCGAWVVAFGPRVAFYGYCCFLVSNVSWLGFAAYHEHWWQFSQQVLFFGSTLLGLWKCGRLKSTPSPNPLPDARQ